MPFIAGIEVTRACNFRCTHCMVDAGRRLSPELQFDEICSLLSQLALAGVEEICWSGGEPLLRRDLARLTAKARDLGFFVSLVTNGFLAGRETLRRLRQSGLQAIQVSLDGPDLRRAERYRRGPPSWFDRATEAIRNSAAEGLDTTACSMLTPETAADVEEMMSLVGRLGAGTLRYAAWMQTGRAQGIGWSEQQWAGPDVRRLLGHHAQGPAPTAPSLMLDCPTGALPGEDRFNCNSGLKSLYVCADGSLYPCTALMVPEYCAGNIRTRPLADIMSDIGMIRVQLEMAKAPAGGRCRDCAILPQCNGACPGRALIAWGTVRGAPHDGEAPACLRRLHCC